MQGDSEEPNKKQSWEVKELSKDFRCWPSQERQNSEFESSQINCLLERESILLWGREMNPESGQHIVHNAQHRIKNSQTWKKQSREKAVPRKITQDDLGVGISHKVLTKLCVMPWSKIWLKWTCGGSQKRSERGRKKKNQMKTIKKYTIWFRKITGWA